MFTAHLFRSNDSHEWFCGPYFVCINVVYNLEFALFKTEQNSGYASLYHTNRIKKEKKTKLENIHTHKYQLHRIFIRKFSLPFCLWRTISFPRMEISLLIFRQNKSRFTSNHCSRHDFYFTTFALETSRFIAEDDHSTVLTCFRQKTVDCPGVYLAKNKWNPQNVGFEFGKSVISTWVISLLISH